MTQGGGPIQMAAAPLRLLSVQTPFGERTTSETAAGPRPFVEQQLAARVEQ